MLNRFSSTKTDRFSRYRNLLLSDINEDEAMELLVIKLLSEDEYWERLWVVQEIGKATQIRVCYQIRRFGSDTPGANVPFQPQDCELEWESFIQTVRSSKAQLRDIIWDSHLPEFSLEETGPLRLDQQLRGKYRGSHSLRSLLETHHNTLCQNPRDKIYGLAGLADDCYGFPVDYEKSLFEVWSDTLKFLETTDQTQSDLPGLALLMMNALGGPSELAPRPSLTSNVQLWLPLRLVGVIAHIGPTPTQCIASLSEADNWTACMRKNGRQGVDVEANERLLLTLLERKHLESPCLGVLSLAGVPYQAAYRMKDDAQLAWGLQKAREHISGGLRHCPKGESRLYQLMPLDWETHGCSLGVARGNLMAMDIICRLPETGIMLVLRWTETGQMWIQREEGPVSSNCYRIVGLAVDYNDTQLPTGSWARTRALDSPGQAVSLSVEAEVLYSLLSPQVGDEESSYPSPCEED